jgi:hypothetical protein
LDWIRSIGHGGHGRHAADNDETQDPTKLFYESATAGGNASAAGLPGDRSETQ